MKNLAKVLMAVSAMGTLGTQTAYAGYIQSVDASTTRDWIQVIDTSRLAISEIISRCDSVSGACSGSVTNFLGTTTNLAGLTWASTAQVESLFRSRGGILAEGTIVVGAGSNAHPRLVLNVDDNIGNGWLDTDGAGTADSGIFETYRGASFLAGWSRNTLLRDGLPAYARVNFLGLAGIDQIYFPEQYDVNTTGSNTLIGAFLFREATTVIEPPPPPPPPTGTVPLPSTLAILGLGLLGLMRSRFSKPT